MSKRNIDLTTEELEEELERRKNPKGNWDVTMTCKVKKVVYCQDCTEEEARENPFDFAVEEQESEHIDWDVTMVEPNN